MPNVITINLDRPVRTTSVLGVTGIGPGSDSNDQAKEILQQAQAQNQENAQLWQVLNQLVQQIEQMYEKLFYENREKIANLAVEIAKKILTQQIKQGDYDIQQVIEKTIEKAPQGQTLLVRLNPEDLLKCQKLQKDQATQANENIEFVGDSNLACAQCVIETPKGMVESLIDQQLEKVEKALINAG